MANEKQLIDANELMSDVYRSDEQQKNDVWHTSDIEYLVMAQPTVDAVEVVHSEWERFRHPSGTHGIRCKNCKEQNGMKKPYCPNCGAKMDGDGNA